MSEQNNETVQGKLSKLSELVTWFQSPEFKLEDAFDKFKQAEVLAEEIEKRRNPLKRFLKKLYPRK